MCLAKLVAMGAYDVGDFEYRPHQNRDLRRDVKIITETMVSKADLANTLAEERGKSEHEKKIEDLRTRVNVLESKLGIKPAHRAA